MTNDPIISLKNRWHRLFNQLGIMGKDEEFDRLVAAYAEPQRAYHTLRHVSECLELLDWANEQVEIRDQVLIEAALWFHDVVYGPQQDDNERQSAEWARSVLSAAGLDEKICDQICQLIMATDHTRMPANTAVQWLVDIDLAILGSAPARFAEYEQQIRSEYEGVPSASYQQKRREVLASFLKRPRIYHAELFQSRLDAQARHNLGQAIRLRSYE